MNIYYLPLTDNWAELCANKNLRKDFILQPHILEEVKLALYYNDKIIYAQIDKYYFDINKRSLEECKKYCDYLNANLLKLQKQYHIKNMDKALWKPFAVVEI